jgi:hypothetical protein
MNTPFTDDDDASDNNMHGSKKDVKITNMIPFHCHVPVQQHNTQVTTKVMTSTDTIMETNSNGTNLLTPPQSKTHHSDHSHHHSSSHNHHDQVKSKNKSKDPSSLISMSVLKSMLQKAVRRKIVMKAIRLTRYCMKEIHQLSDRCR